MHAAVHICLVHSKDDMVRELFDAERSFHADMQDPERAGRRSTRGCLCRCHETRACLARCLARLRPGRRPGQFSSVSSRQTWQKELNCWPEGLTTTGKRQRN